MSFFGADAYFFKKKYKINKFILLQCLYTTNQLLAANSEKYLQNLRPYNTFHFPQIDLSPFNTFHDPTDTVD